MASVNGPPRGRPAKPSVFAEFHEWVFVLESDQPC